MKVEYYSSVDEIWVETFIAEALGIMPTRAKYSTEIKDSKQIKNINN